MGGERATEPDVAIVGAGPAGLAAAVATAATGASAVLIDESPGPGGQIWRPRRDGRLPERARERTAEIEGLGVELVPATLVWAVSGERSILLHRDGERPRSIAPRALVLATGAHDRPLAFPGWTLPGVLTAGGLQALAKAQEAVRGRRVLLAGSGPFLFPVACSLLDGGAELVGIAEASRRRDWLGRAARVRHAPGRLLELARYESRLRRARVPRMYGSLVAQAIGGDRVERVELRSVDREWRPVAGTQPSTFEVDTLGLGYGFQPNLELARLLDCRLVYSERERQFVVWRTPRMETSVRGVYAAGELGGIGGWELAACEGWLAGIAAAEDCERVDASPRRTRSARRRARRLQRFADLLADLFAPRSGALDVIEQGTPICRCEGVTSGQLQRALAVRSVNPDPAALKAVTRVGMGPCQGRICGQLVAQVAARCGATGHPGAFGLPSARPPVKPIKIEALSSLTRGHESGG